MTKLILKSPAKLNLFLRVLHLRTDGYHELASLFQAIDLFDFITFDTSTQDCLTCSDPSLPTGPSNLVRKAVHLFREKTGVQTPFAIHLQKNIPQQAGLGGGSSNAATTLWGVNQLCGNPIPTQTLADWSAQIGSDVPFFFSNGTAYCTGRGEKVKGLAPLKNQKICVVKPKEGLSTPLVYKKLKVAELIQRDPLKALNQILEREEGYFNDLEMSAFEIAPNLSNLKSRLLEKGFSTALMSGSGSSFFCLGEGSLVREDDLIAFPATFTHRSDHGWY